MAYRSLREFIAKLEAAGELVRVKEPVSSVLEMTEIHRRLLAKGGPAVIFENVIRADGERSSMPCLINLFGTVKRVAMWPAWKLRGLRPSSLRPRMNSLCCSG